MSDDQGPETPPNAGTPDPESGQPAPVRLELDPSQAGTSYANMCAVTPMPLEVILDFVLMTGPPERQRGPIKVSNRVVLNYFSAKQLMLALRRAVERYEAMYGMLELDPRKRLTPSARETLVQQSGPAPQAEPDNVGEAENDDKTIH